MLDNANVRGKSTVKLSISVSALMIKRESARSFHHESKVTNADASASVFYRSDLKNRNLMNHIKRNANKYLLTRFSHSIITFIINNNMESRLLAAWATGHVR